MFGKVCPDGPGTGGERHDRGKKYRLKVVGLPLVKEEKIVKHDAEVLAKFIARGRY